jgi:hypothetical protein
MGLSGRVTTVIFAEVALFSRAISASKLSAATGVRCPFQDLLMEFKRRN